MTTYEICYLSKASPCLTNDELKIVLEETTHFNNNNGITGVLLFSSGTFFQVLEGDETQITHLFYNKIMKDSRHSDIYTILQKSTKIPFFQGYSSKFVAIQNKIEINQIKEYIIKHNIQDDPKRFRRLLIPYLTTALTSSQAF
ncbi:BLUF domain-containing protein [Aquimarina agarilytica]|uniref:BLUF domain-containing protein n=1 Tax=Aquimarina agarilytica TaxID=1087449 RepID=UPI0002888C21|nr:BLUF domain-containing protein [Aquimarina agarilytica]